MSENEKKAFEDLSEERQGYFQDKATDLLSGLLWCQRVWEAWDKGTMDKHDFVDADEDDLVVYTTAVALYDLVQENKSE